MLMRARLLPAFAVRHARQRGAALLIMLAIVGVGVGALLVNALTKSSLQLQRDRKTYLVLGQAKDALIAWATIPNGSAPGQLPIPDALDPAEAAPLNYNGDRNTGCVFTTWVPGNALITSGGTMRCMGRLPWRSLNMTMQAPSENDAPGEMPWYAVSANLTNSCAAFLINPTALNWVYPGAFVCNAVQLPYPWLTVRDAKGNILSNRVAAVIVMPGLPLGAQTRPSAPLSGPANYLDTITVSAGCAAPCVPGTYNNASLNPGNDFIMGFDYRQVSATDPDYTQPYNFNDRLVYITIDELMAAAEKSAATYARRSLLNFYATKTYYPFAAALGSAAGNCVTATTRGMLPRATGSCAANDFLGGIPASSALPAWFTANNWQNFIYYTVAPACAPGTLNCGGAGFLTVGAVANARALLIAAGRPVANVAGQVPAMTTPPFASKGSAQTGYPSVTVNDYLDSAINTDGNNIYDAVGTARTTTYNDQMIIVAP
jgi:hypothetical protein